MKNPKTNCRFKTSGQGLVILIIVLILVGGGLWYLYSHKQQMDKEARAFGRQMIERLAVNHDLAFFSSHLSPQARLDMPPSQQQFLIQQMTELGVPAQPMKIDENITWESHFFEPHGFFTAELNYPAGQAKLELAIDHPVSRWQVVNLTFSKPRTR
jgi:hypothetical protein